MGENSSFWEVAASGHKRGETVTRNIKIKAVIVFLFGTMFGVVGYVLTGADGLVIYGVLVGVASAANYAVVETKRQDEF